MFGSINVGFNWIILKLVKYKQTLRSLKVSVATNRTEMGKKADESASGTTNSMDPLPNTLVRQNIK